MTFRGSVILYLLLLTISGFAQNNRGSLPYSWNAPNSISFDIPFETVGPVDIGTLMKEDQDGSLDKTAPYRFAHTIDVSLGTNISGRWLQLAMGNRLWVQGIDGIDAEGVGFILDDIYLPTGSTLHIFDESHTDLLGKFTAESNPESGQMVLPHIIGDRVILEYYEPATVRGEGRILIGGINYVYRDTDSIKRDSDPEHDCHVNIQCPDVRDWSTVENSVVRISTDHGTRWGTGVLVNTTDHKSKPYVITSANNVIGSTALMNFLFEFESSGCSSERIRPSKFIMGAKVKAHDVSTNLILLELNESPDPSWGIFYAGWDRSGQKPTSAGCVHHPAGDLKKCSASGGDLMTNENWQGANTWMVDRWELGSTERGSMGAPVFNEKGLAVGFLIGGYSECQSPKEDFVVKFRDAWGTFQDFLDPSGTGSQVFGGQSPINRPTDERIIESEVAFFPNPANDILKIYNENEEAVIGIRVFDMNQKLVDELPLSKSTINISHLPIGMYVIELQLESFSIKDRLVIFR